MSQSEAIVLIGRLESALSDLRDLADDAPLHVAMARGVNMDAISEAINELKRQYKIGA